MFAERYGWFCWQTQAAIRTTIGENYACIFRLPAVNIVDSKSRRVVVLVVLLRCNNLKDKAVEMFFFICLTTQCVKEPSVIYLYYIFICPKPWALFWCIMLASANDKIQYQSFSWKSEEWYFTRLKLLHSLFPIDMYVYKVFKRLV